ncbi:hypothetical protein KIPB_010674 [Kipferlia bialata]|uniref:Guanylate cyclase domain-containing protein n=1 Tax=Kipferlia bialata TaxID=797122 RepID=A0A9K3D4F0_9EUKA|nr:hypothetical protein KIPB_010674 [Kipferlia bialata]|eukprot:g10674.t1
MQLLNQLFTEFDRVVVSYASKGVTKVKTIGDAYELKRSFSVDELDSSPVGVVRDAVAAMTRCSYDLVQTALDILKQRGVCLGVRCGLAIGPGMAGTIGRFRISHDIFGMGPSIARGLEGLSPLGHVTVSPLIQLTLGKDNPSFLFGRKVHAMPHTEETDETEGGEGEGAPAPIPTKPPMEPVYDETFVRAAEVYTRTMSQHAGQGVRSERDMSRGHAVIGETLPHYHISNPLLDVSRDHLVGVVLMSVEEDV